MRWAIAVSMLLAAGLSAGQTQENKLEAKLDSPYLDKTLALS